MKRFCVIAFAIFAVSCSTTSSSTPETKVSQVVGEEVTYVGDGVQLKGYLAYDKAQEGPRPGVLVVHEWWGHNEYTRDRARQLAALGYTALAVDMYGDGKQADHPEDAQKFMMEVMSNMDGAVARFKAAKDLLNSHATTDPSATGAIGYCFGGAVVLHMARTGMDLDAIAAFHAGALNTGLKAEPGTIQGRVLVAQGADDPFVPAEAIAEFKEEFDTAGVDYTYVAYPGAVHAFTNPGATAKGKKFELPLAYNKEADEKSWAAMKAMFEEVF